MVLSRKQFKIYCILCHLSYSWTYFRIHLFVDFKTIKPDIFQKKLTQVWMPNSTCLWIISFVTDWKEMRLESSRLILLVIGQKQVNASLHTDRKRTSEKKKKNHTSSSNYLQQHTVHCWSPPIPRNHQLSGLWWVSTLRDQLEKGPEETVLSVARQ